MATRYLKADLSTGNKVASSEVIPIADGGTAATTAPLALQALGAQPVFNGLEDPTRFSVSYSAASRQFTITYTGTAAYTVNGVRYTKTGSDVTTAHAATTGKWFCYYDSSGVLAVSGTAWDIKSTAQIAFVYYTTSNNGGAASAILYNERHPGVNGFDSALHDYLHVTRGTQLESGLVLSGATLNTSGATAVSYGVSSGVIRDEDIPTTTTAVTDGGTYRTIWKTGTTAAPVWNWKDTANSGIEDNGTNIYYNQSNGGNWQLTELGSNNLWVNYWLIAIPSYSAPHVMAIMGQTTHSSLALAQAATFATEISDFPLFTAEAIILYRITYRRGGAFGTPGNAQMAGFTPVTQSLVVASSAGSATAATVPVDVTNFDGYLTATDNTVQKALDSLDNLVIKPNDTLNRLQARLFDSAYRRLGDNVFYVSGATRVGSATATQNLVNNSYLFATSGVSNLISVNHLDSDFLSKTQDVTSVEIMGEWLSSAVDTAATWSVTRNGSEYQNVTMTRVGATGNYRGTLTFTDEVTQQTIDSYAGSNDINVTLNATTQQAIAAQVLSPGTSTIRRVTLTVNKLGSPTGYIRIKLVKDSSGSPSTAAADSFVLKDGVDISTITTGSLVVNVSQLTFTGTYWIVVETVGYGYSAGVNELRWCADNTSPTDPVGKIWNGSAWSALTTTAMLYVLEGRNLDLRVKVVAGTNAVELLGYGCYYDYAGSFSGTVPVVDRFSIPANTDVYTFTCTKFRPHPDTTFAILEATGQIFDFGAFSINGMDIVFPAGTFVLPADSVLKVRQLGASGAFDNSDQNAARVAQALPDQYNLTVTGTNWTTTRAVGVPYLTNNGVWRFRFNVRGSFSAPTAGVTLTLSGIALAASYQAISGMQSDDNTTYPIWMACSGGNQINAIFSAAKSSFYFSGEVELASKPTFVP